MKKEIWLYPAQAKITAYLTEKFGECYRHEFQNVCKYVAYETYQCWLPKEQGKEQFQQRITFVIHKPVNNVYRPAIIEVCISHYESTMQYFATTKTKETAAA